MCSWFIYVALALAMYTSALINHLFWSNSARSEAIDHKPAKDFEDLYNVSYVHILYYILLLFNDF